MCIRDSAKGGAGLVYTEMTCVSANGRITPGCPGLYSPKHEAGWKRINDFIHAETKAKTCCQIGHAWRKGSTQVGWADADGPLVSGNWPLLSASAIPWSAGNATPKAMDRADMDKVVPVSYTHLDVYKRQCPHRGQARGSLIDASPGQRGRGLLLR